MTTSARSETVRLDDLPIAVALIDPNGTVGWVNAPMQELLGRDPTGRSLVGLAAPHSVDLVQHVLDTGETRTVAFRYPDGPERVVDLFSAPTAAGAACLVFAHRSRVELEILEDLAREANDLLGQGVIIGDATRILHVSPTAAAIFGRTVEELVATPDIFDLFEETERVRITVLVTTLASAGRQIPEHYETVIVRPDGSHLPVDLSIKFTIRGAVTRTFTIITDATERRAQQRELAHRAFHDQLTGLPNRYLLRERLEMLLHRLAREPAEGALLFIDLDRFKTVNDRHGHAAGDEVLRTVAGRLEKSLRAEDTAARVGGDEFVVLCEPGRRDETPDLLVTRLRERILEPVRGSGWSATVGASIGVVTFSDATLGPDELLARVDAAMYEDKPHDR